jgi:hypothetical protein
VSGCARTLRTVLADLPNLEAAARAVRNYVVRSADAIALSTVLLQVHGRQRRS